MAEEYCSRCGTARSAGAAFCSKCGQAFQVAETASPAPPAQASPAKTSSWSLGRILGIVVVIAVGLAVLGQLDKRATGAPAPIASTAGGGSTRSAQTITGSGISKSQPFELEGDYNVTWTATPDSDVGCYHGANLQRADGSSIFEVLANELLNSKAPKTGSTRLYGLDRGRYYVDASSGCAWSFTFSPA